LIDLDVHSASERRERDQRDRFETSDLAFHERVRDGYLAMAREFADTWLVVDGSGSEEDVARRIDDTVATLAWSRG
jgi:dTMP kinase